MAGTTNALTSSDIGMIESPQAVARQVKMKLRDPFIYVDLLEFIAIGTAPSYREVLDDYGDKAPTAPVDETDEIPAEDEDDWSETTATPALYSTRAAISDKARGNTDKGLVLRSVARRVDNCAQRIEFATVNTATLAATVIGTDATAMTKSFYIASLNTFRSASGSDPGNIAWVMHPDQFGALVLDLGSDAAALFGGNNNVAQGAAGLIEQQRSGKMGRWLNCDIYTSPLVPVSGAGHAGMLLRTGSPAAPPRRGRIDSVLGMVWKPPPEGAGMDEIRVEVERSGIHSRTDAVGRVWFSVMIRDQTRIAQVVTQE